MSDRVYTIIEEAYDHDDLKDYLVYYSCADEVVAMKKIAEFVKDAYCDPWFDNEKGEAIISEYVHGFGCMVGNRELRYVVIGTGVYR